MPELSRFFGIVIRMFMEVGAPHQCIDFRPVLEGEVFGALQDVDLFNALEPDPTFGTIQWPNGADFDPETLHDWPKYRDELAAMARQWAAGPQPVQRMNDGRIGNSAG